MYAVEKFPVEARAYGGPQRAPSVDLRRQKVGHTELRREDLALMDAGRVMVVSQALGPPRLWAYLLDTAVDAFRDGYDAAEGSMLTRLNHGMRMATHHGRARINGLLERRGADIGLLAVGFDGPSLHVLGVGALDVYLYRRKQLRIVGERSSSEGMFKGNATTVVEHVEPGDLLFASSQAVCSDALLYELQVALDHDRGLPPDEVVAAIGASAAARGLAAASLSVRIPASF